MTKGRDHELANPGACGCCGVLLGRNGDVRKKSQVVRPSRTSRHCGSDSQGPHAARRHGSAAHTAGRVRIGYGATELGGTPPRADTHFRIASNTQMMTVAVIVQLVQKGKLRFDDVISKYVEGVPNG